jgi:hypothetical protein
MPFLELHTGDEIFHPTFGEGIVMNAVPGDSCVEVLFDDGIVFIDVDFEPLLQLTEKSLEVLNRRLTSEEAKVAMLEKASRLEKRLRKYKQSDPAETWASRWVASLIAYLLSEQKREEWLGDLYEVNREMLHKGYSPWIVNLIDVGKSIVLIVSAFKIKLLDIISIGARERK